MWHESKPNETEKGNRRLRDVVAFITRRSDVQIGFRVISTGLTAPHFPFPTRFSAFSYTNFHAQRKISIQNLFLAYKTGSIFFKALIELNEDVHFFAERCILRDDQIWVIFPLCTSSFYFFDLWDSPNVDWEFSNFAHELSRLSLWTSHWHFPVILAISFAPHAAISFHFSGLWDWVWLRVASGFLVFG